MCKHFSFLDNKQPECLVVSGVEESVGKLDGGKNVNVQLVEGKVDVEFDSLEISLENIKETIMIEGIVNAKSW